MDMKELSYLTSHHDDIPDEYRPGLEHYPVKILNAEGDIYDIDDLVWDETNQTYYLKVVLSEE